MTTIHVRSARLYEVALPLRDPFRISGGTLEVRRSLIVALEDERGHVGYGEAAPFEAPFYSAETTASARSMLVEHLLPRLLRHAVSHSSELHDLLTEGVVGNPMARAGAETAWWDLQAAATGATLRDLVTRRLRELEVPERWVRFDDRIECGVALGIPAGRDLGYLEREVREALARGYRRVKLKVMPGWDVEPVSAAADVMKSTGTSVPLTVDANGAYHLERHLEDLRRLDDLNLLHIEQPFPDHALWDHQWLARTLRTPICLDESLTSAEVARQVVAMGGPDVWNIKIQRVGGLEEACRVYRIGVETGVRLWGGTMPETGIGAQAMLALGCHAGFVFPSDLEPSDRWYDAGTDLVRLAMNADGSMPVPAVRPRVEPDDQWAMLAELRSEDV